MRSFPRRGPTQDPAFRLIGSEKVLERGAALTSRLQSFETELLTQRENLAGLARISRDLIAKAEVIVSAHRVVLDMDRTEVPVYGRQEQSAYYGHFESTCYRSCCCSTAQATAWRRNCARARQGIAAYFDFYNHERLHQALGYRAPAPGVRGSDALSQASAREKNRWR